MLLEGLPLAKKKIKYLSIIAIIAITCISCQQEKSNLPIFGNREVNEKGDTIYHQIPEFNFVNQMGDSVSEKKYKNKIYVADFFFTSCPGICPIMTKQLKRVQNSFTEQKDKLLILSHTVDPETDTMDQLLKYGKKKKADFTNWDFVTGKKKDLYKMAEHYLVVANEDPNTEIKFVHSEMLVLIDTKKQIRGMYDGTDSIAVNQLIKDINTLIEETWK